MEVTSSSFVLQGCASYSSKTDGDNVSGGNSHLLSEREKRDHLHYSHKDDLENIFPEVGRSFKALLSNTGVLYCEGYLAIP